MSTASSTSRPDAGCTPGVDGKLLVPKNTWKNPEQYEARARDLATQFNKNFAEKYADVSDDLRPAGPQA